jgi:hypothetical protein
MAGAAGPPIPGGGSIIPPTDGAPATAPPGAPTAGTGVCAPEAAKPAGTAAGGADVAPAIGLAAGEAVPGIDGGGLAGGTALATPELAAILRENDAEGSTVPAPGILGAPDNPDGDVAACKLPAPDDNVDNGLPPPKLPKPPPGSPLPAPGAPPLNGDGDGDAEVRGIGAGDIWIGESIASPRVPVSAPAAGRFGASASTESPRAPDSTGVRDVPPAAPASLRPSTSPGAPPSGDRRFVPPSPRSPVLLSRGCVV